MTRFEEIICSSETARAIMSVCDLGKTGFVAWLYDWQTLIAGSIASISIIFLIRQTQMQKEALLKQFEKDNLEAKQQKKAALIRVPHALSDIDDYLKDCYKVWEDMKPEERPKPPSEALNVIMNAAPYIDEESFESFRQLIIESQTFETRVSMIKENPPSNLMNMMVADIATFLYLNMRLFKYARIDKDVQAIPYIEPKREDLENALGRLLTYKDARTDPVFERIKEALDERFPKRKNPPQ